MSTVTQHDRPRRLKPSYLRLVKEWPLRPIRSESEYKAAGRILDRLVLRSDLDPGERDYLGALEVLIEAFDDEHFPDLPDGRPVHERLVGLMESSGTSPAELQRILSTSQSLVSLMLSGKRELSKKTIATLAEHFQVDAGYFL